MALGIKGMMRDGSVVMKLHSIERDGITTNV